MNIILTIVSILLVIINIYKVYLYVTLDEENDYPIEVSSAKGYIYFLKYDKHVAPEDEGKKRLANRIHVISMIVLVVFLIAWAVTLINTSNQKQAQNTSIRYKKIEGRNNFV